MIREFDYKFLSKEGVYFCCLLYANADVIRQHLTRKRDKICKASFYWRSEKAYAEGKKILYNRIIFENIVSIIHNNIDSDFERDILFSKLGFAWEGARDRNYYRKRASTFRELGYKLCRSGITDKVLKENGFPSFFSDWIKEARELIKKIIGVN